MKNVLHHARPWLAGVALAGVGIVVARLVAPLASAGARVPLTVLGQLIAVGGLFVICAGVSRRVRCERELGGGDAS
jgi:hypothetical protein